MSNKQEDRQHAIEHFHLCVYDLIMVGMNAQEVAALMSSTLKKLPAGKKAAIELPQEEQPKESEQ